MILPVADRENIASNVARKSLRDASRKADKSVNENVNPHARLSSGAETARVDVKSSTNVHRYENAHTIHENGFVELNLVGNVLLEPNERKRDSICESQDNSFEFHKPSKKSYCVRVFFLDCKFINSE